MEIIIVIASVPTAFAQMNLQSCLSRFGHTLYKACAEEFGNGGRANHDNETTGKVLQIASTYMGYCCWSRVCDRAGNFTIFHPFRLLGNAYDRFSNRPLHLAWHQNDADCQRIRAKSYEDLNKVLFGEQYGRWISHFMFVILLGVTAVMLAGAGTIFYENWNISYQSGLLITIVGCYFLLRKGMKSILMVNAIVVPVDAALYRPHYYRYIQHARRRALYLACQRSFHMGSLGCAFPVCGLQPVHVAGGACPARSRNTRS